MIDDADPRLMVRLRGRTRQTDEARATRSSPRTGTTTATGSAARTPRRASTSTATSPSAGGRDDGTPGGTGDYPTSSPEVQAVAEFFRHAPATS
ncbi:MAG: hypothetical protein MZU84_04600 [Sphingobacterium sp.]|nr:hypothetical protein [Sphingobacterium sp.]